MKLRFLSLGLVSFFLASCGGPKTQTAENEPKKVHAITISKTDAVLESSYPAIIKGEEDVSIRPRVDGFIEQVYVDEGSKVRAGTPLFRINSPSTDEALRASEAAVNSAQANLKTAELNVEKIKPLVKEGIISEYQLQTAENVASTARASLAQAQASLTNARAMRSWATVTSPVDGVVGKVNFRKGSLVDRGSELTTVANTTNVYAYFSLSEKELLEFLNSVPGKNQEEKIKNSAPVRFILLDRSEYGNKGKLETISGLVNTATGSVNCRAKFSNVEGMLRSGSSGSIIIPKVLSNVVVIPQKATFAQQDKVLVYKIEEGVAVQSVLEVYSMPNGLDYAVVSGLDSGDAIVSEGINSITNGDNVAIIGQQGEKTAEEENQE